MDWLLLANVLLFLVNMLYIVPHISVSIGIQHTVQPGITG